jgi:hypothetical protein
LSDVNAELRRTAMRQTTTFAGLSGMGRPMPGVLRHLNLRTSWVWRIVVSKASRDKGKVGEREVGHMLDRYKLPYLREQDGRTQGADFLIDRRFAAEVKRRERFSLVEAHRHVERMADDHIVPLVIWRPSREPWRVSMLLTDFLDMAEETA